MKQRKTSYRILAWKPNIKIKLNFNEYDQYEHLSHSLNIWRKKKISTCLAKLNLIKSFHIFLMFDFCKHIVITDKLLKIKLDFHLAEKLEYQIKSKCFLYWKQNRNTFYVYKKKISKSRKKNISHKMSGKTWSFIQLDLSFEKTLKSFKYWQLDILIYKTKKIRIYQKIKGTW